MEWPWHRCQRILPGQLAHALYTEFVNGRNLPFPDIPLAAESVPRFAETMRVHRIALVILALASQEARDQKFLTVRECLEALAFGVHRPEAIDLLGAVRAAMTRLNQLLSGANRGQELSWAMTLLSDAGITETNPVRLTLCATYWMDLYVCVTKSLKEFKVDV